MVGGQSTFNFQENYDTVTILNASAKNVEVINIDPVNRIAAPEVTIDVPVDAFFSFNVGQKFTSTLIDIESTGPSGSDVMVGRHDRQSDRHLRSSSAASGDILQSNEGGLVLTNSFPGKAAARDHWRPRGDSAFQYSWSKVVAGRTHMSVAVGGDIYMSLRRAVNGRWGPLALLSTSIRSVPGTL